MEAALPLELVEYDRSVEETGMVAISFHCKSVLTFCVSLYR
jgi:hypothetical protein